VAIAWPGFIDPEEQHRLAADLRAGLEPSVRHLATQLQQTLQRITDAPTEEN
jgi:hypothetical protein